MSRPIRNRMSNKPMLPISVTESNVINIYTHQGEVWGSKSFECALSVRFGSCSRGPGGFFARAKQELELAWGFKTGGALCSRWDRSFKTLVLKRRSWCIVGV